MSQVVLIPLPTAMQSWSVQRGRSEYPTTKFPTLSGIVGLVGAAMGIQREDDSAIAELVTLDFAVRLDAVGQSIIDLQTAAYEREISSDEFGYLKPSLSELSTGNSRKMNKQYLADASFIVALSESAKTQWSRSDSLVQDISDALKKPVYPLYLGRRSSLVGALDSSIVDSGSAADALREGMIYPLSYRSILHYTVDAPSEATGSIQDIPLSFSSVQRKYQSRYYREEHLQSK